MRRVSVAVLLALGLSACANVLSAGAAVVNGARISQTELESQIDAQLKQAQGGPQGPEGRVEVARQVLGSLIQQELLRQEAVRRRITVPEKDLDAQFTEIRGQFPTQQEFDERLKAFGLTAATLRLRIRDSLQADKLRTALVGEVGPKQVQEFYDSRKNDYRQVRVKHILLAVDPQTPDAAARKEANTTFSELAAGASFTKLAKERSDDPGSKDKGGILEGFVPLSQLDQAFGTAAFVAKIGKVTRPVRSQFGYHLIVTLAKRVQPLNEVRAQITQQLTQEAGEAALGVFLGDAAKKANIIVNPRYGDWDASSGSVIPHKLFEPPTRPADQDGLVPNLDLPPGITQPGQSGAPPGGP